MEPNPGIAAVQKLAQLGYRFTVNGETIKARYEGQGKPDPGQVRPLVDLMKAYKDEVRYFLRSFCPRCGGCCFAPDYEERPQCMACDCT